MDGRRRNSWEIQGKICTLACQIAHKSWSDSTQLVFFIMTRTKSTLGRVWARYYNWYGMTGKLRAALSQHGWMEERIDSYDRANHLTVSPDHEGENPNMPAPNDYAWLRRHTPLPGRVKPSRSQLRAKAKKGTAQPAEGKKKPCRYRPGTVAL